MCDLAETAVPLRTTDGIRLHQNARQSLRHRQNTDETSKALAHHPMRAVNMAATEGTAYVTALTSNMRSI